MKNCLDHVIVTNLALLLQFSSASTTATTNCETPRRHYTILTNHRTLIIIYCMDKF